MDVLIGTLLTILLLIAVLAIIGRRIAKKLTARQKNWWLIAHIMFVIVYFSGVLGTLLLTSVAGTIVADGEQIHAAHLFGKYCDWFMIIPGAFGSLVTGVWLALRTHWGLTKYYWIMVKTIGNIATILFGSYSMRIWFDQTVALSSVGQVSFLQNPAYLHNRQMLIIGAIISAVFLTFYLIISVLKPWGKRLQ